MDEAPRTPGAASVSLSGKLCRLGILRYTPNGTALWEAELAFPQWRLGKRSTGYCVLSFEEELAVVASQRLRRIGAEVAVTGQLWSRKFRDARGDERFETKILVTNFQEKERDDGRENRQSW
jgi:single-stranded DNA-binding protein